MEGRDQAVSWARKDTPGAFGTIMEYCLEMRDQDWGTTKIHPPEFEEHLGPGG